MSGEMTEGGMRGEEGGEEDGALGTDCEGSLPRFRSFRLGIRGERRHGDRVVRSRRTRLGEDCSQTPGRRLASPATAGHSDLDKA